jgi:GNAT superfamily N-acetyltransferase
MVKIEAATEANTELHAAMARLLPQLNATLAVPSLERLQAMMDDPDVTLLLARDGHRVVGTATVIVYTTPFWLKARLDEVVVDESDRGRGVGELLVKACLDVARRNGAQIAELQSGRGQARDVANRLYRKLGFEPRDTNVYRMVL